MGVYLALFMLVALFADVELVQVSVSQGTLEGDELTTVIGNETYFSFKGIPFAAPPVGRLRFLAPQPPLNWTGVRSAREHCSSCPQLDIFTAIINLGSEDCLCLNVYTPTLNATTPLPVIFFNFGGGFQSGSGNSSDYGPDFLVTKGVVLVTFNHRVGALGFLSLGTREVPGNAGLKDQVAALRWVKQNIAKFGGDPDNVTIMGQSSGAASTSYHLVSPMSRGLFKRAIVMSGSALCDFVTSYKPVERAFRLGKNHGINTQNTTVLLNQLQALPVDQLVNTTNCTILTSEPIYNILIKHYNFPPVIERRFGRTPAFITKDVYNVLKEDPINDVDVMFGYTNKETSAISDTIVSTLLQLYDYYAEILVPTKWFFRLRPDKNLELASLLRSFYIGNGTSLDVNVLDKFIDFTSHASFVVDVIRFISILPKSDKARYLYKLSVNSSLNYNGNSANKYNLFGHVGHLDDMNYLFSNSRLNTSIVTEDSTEWRLITQITTLVTNFAKYGNPTPSDSGLVTWPQFDTTNKNYMDIGNTLTAQTNPEADAMTFWEQLYDNAGFGFF